MQNLEIEIKFYLADLEGMRKNLNLEFKDITFNNFETVDVGASAFVERLEADNS
jgi:hypothetical protein